MFVRTVIATVAIMQLMIVPGKTQVVKPDSAHRYQGGAKTEEHVTKDAKASMEYNSIGTTVSRDYVHQYHGGPKGH